MEKMFRTLLILLVGSFPLAVYQFSLVKAGAGSVRNTVESFVTRGPAMPQKDIMELNSRVDMKAREIQAIDVKILENKGTILQLEEDRSKAIKDLEDFQSRLSNILKDIRGEQRTEFRSNR